MNLMSSEMKLLGEFPSFVNLFRSFDCAPAPGGFMPVGAVLGTILIGAIATFVIQSSSAAIGIIIALGVIFGVLCLESWLIMLLWNATLPVVFGGVTAIGFWQSVCINLLVILLFGGVGKIITALIKKD
jgi:hypothetical protein